MAILTKDRLTAVVNSRLGTRTFSGVLNEAKQESKAYADVTVFLSHSHDDLSNGYLDKTIVFLRQMGIRVYIDSNDSSLPPFTNAVTAQKIKHEIKNNKKFILLATDNAIKSKWCNWELGYGDSIKYIQNIALFPLADSAGTWQGNEYLRIYPRIEEVGFMSNTYQVIFPDGSSVPLSNWLS